MKNTPHWLYQKHRRHSNQAVVFHDADADDAVNFLRLEKPGRPERRVGLFKSK